MNGQPQGQVLSRDASRALDAQIAEKVMGLSVITVDEECSSMTPGAMWNPGAEFYSLPIDYTVPAGAPDDAEPEFYLEPYSTDIAAAWLVIEKMAERGFHARVQSPFIPGDAYHAGFTPHGSSGWNGRPDFRADADTAPLAICRAALAAVEAV